MCLLSEQKAHVLRGAPICKAADIPEFEGTIIGARDDPVSCLVEGTTSNAISMAFEGKVLLTSMDIPEFERLIIGSRNDPIARGADGGIKNAEDT